MFIITHALTFIHIEHKVITDVNLNRGSYLRDERYHSYTFGARFRAPVVLYDSYASVPRDWEFPAVVEAARFGHPE